MCCLQNSEVLSTLSQLDLETLACFLFMCLLLQFSVKLQSCWANTVVLFSPSSFQFCSNFCILFKYADLPATKNGGNQLIAQSCFIGLYRLPCISQTMKLNEMNNVTVARAAHEVRLFLMTNQGGLQIRYRPTYVNKDTLQQKII